MMPVVVAPQAIVGNVSRRNIFQRNISAVLFDMLKDSRDVTVAGSLSSLLVETHAGLMAATSRKREPA